jgi:hypothetical protein
MIDLHVTNRSDIGSTRKLGSDQFIVIIVARFYLVFALTYRLDF